MAQKLKLVTSQFTVSSDIDRNIIVIKEQIKISSQQNADIIHFFKCSLSSYAGIDFPEFTSEATTKIQNGITTICELAKVNNF